MLVYDCADDAYKDLGEKLLKEGVELSPRGLETKEFVNVNIRIDNPLDYLTSRTHLSYFFGELLWYVSKNDFIDQIIPYAPYWKEITNSDGTVNSNYGTKVYDIEYGIENVVRIFEKDWSSRKAFIRIGNEYTIDSKDTTCTLSLQFLIRPSETIKNSYSLHQIVTSRSVDITTGFCYDIPFFCFLQQHVLALLQEKIYPHLTLGYYYHNIGSLHYYKSKEEDLKKSLEKSSPNALPVFDMIALDEMFIAISDEERVRENKEIINVDKFASPFWKKCFEVLNKKFIKENVTAKL